MRRYLALLPLLLLPACVSQAGPLKIDYTVAPHPSGMAGPSTAVTIRIHGLRGERSLRLQMAVWSPGDYHVMDHAKYVRDVQAAYEPAAGDQPQPAVGHPDANTWEVPTNGRDALRVTYSLPNTPPGFFSENVHITSTYAFYNGPATYMYVVGHKADPATLHVTLPPDWKRSYTPLPPETQGKPDSYSAPDFDTLADSPLLAGEMVTREFTVAGRPHSIVFFDRHRGMDYDAYVPVIQAIVEEENRLMGGPPYERYGFFLDVGGPGGGLEHLNACRIATSPRANPRFSGGFFAHEFFHLWNVKRIRPEVLGPFDYIHPPHTRNLWWSEGVTDYVSDMTLYRAGLRDERGLYRGFAGEIAGFQSNPNRLKVTADESSLKVWEAGNSSGYGGISYYEKGKLIGLCLDLKLRAATGGHASLDTVMRDLLARYGLPKPGFPEDGIRDAVIRAGGPAMGPFYDLLARRTEEMPFAECFAGVGLRLTGRSGSAYRIEADETASAKAVALREEWLAGRTAAH